MMHKGQGLFLSFICILFHAGDYNPTFNCNSRQVHYCVAGVQIRLKLVTELQCHCKADQM